MVLVRMLLELKNEVHTLGEFRYVHGVFSGDCLGTLAEAKA